MFRDESTKVIRKAHAQWGTPESSGAYLLSSSSPTRSGGPLRTTYSYSPPFPPPTTPPWPSDQNGFLVLSPRIPKAVGPNIIDKGVQFYVQNYLVGHPDEVRTLPEMQTVVWITYPGIPEVMAAIGLGGLANLTRDPEMETAARQKYGQALQHTSKSIQNPTGIEPLSAMRAVVMLALFEVGGALALCYPALEKSDVFLLTLSLSLYVGTKRYHPA
jgi:hypothetical protein